jgi:hypothetical protein
MQCSVLTVEGGSIPAGCSDYLERGRIRGCVDLRKELQRGGAS